MVPIKFKFAMAIFVAGGFLLGGAVFSRLAMAQTGPATQGSDAPATQPADGPLAISIVADPTGVHPGDVVKLAVDIKNTTNADQIILVPNIVWAAQTDSPQVVIPGWPKRGGIGPVVIFKPVTIAAGKSYARAWEANIPPDAPAGDVTFRVGVPLHRTPTDRTWSAPITIKITPKDAANNTDAPNPLYTAWKNQDGKSVTFHRTEEITGGPPIPGAGAGQAAIHTVIYALSDFTAEQAVIKITTDGNAEAETLTIPANPPADDSAPKPDGTEDLKIGDKTYSCTKYTYSTKSPAELGRNSYGIPGQVTVWLADDIPGGIVQRHVALTIKASYDIVDTIVIK